MGFELDGCYLSQRYGFILHCVYQDVMDQTYISANQLNLQFQDGPPQ